MTIYKKYTYVPSPEVQKIGQGANIFLSVFTLVKIFSAITHKVFF